MKTISVLIPCFNEEENVIPLSKAIINEFEQKLPKYNYEIIFIDNCSIDSTRDKLRILCSSSPKIKAIFNARNFGYTNSQFYGLIHTSGDCTILFAADFQDPIEMIPKLVAEWEDGYKIVCAIKNTTKENKILRFFRTCYYKIIKKMSDVKQIEHFYGFGLYDKSFIDVLRKLEDPTPYLRGIVAELGYKRKDIYYEQQKRRAGKTHFNFYGLYDLAMLGFTSYTRVGLRLCTYIGCIVAFLSMIICIVYLILKLFNWYSFDAGVIPMLIGVFGIGGLQLFFIGFLGEYVMAINNRIMNRPLVIEEERLNFDNDTNDENKLKEPADTVS